MQEYSTLPIYQNYSLTTRYSFFVIAKTLVLLSVLSVQHWIQRASSRWLVGWRFGFYGISIFVGYLMQNLFLYKKTVLLQTIQFNISTELNYQNHFDWKIFS